MPAKQQNSNHGGNKKHGRNKEKCAEWRMHHGNQPGKKFTMSKEHRGRGPIGLLKHETNMKKKIRAHDFRPEAVNTAVGLREIPVENFEKIGRSPVSVRI